MELIALLDALGLPGAQLADVLATVAALLLALKAALPPARWLVERAARIADRTATRADNRLVAAAVRVLDALAAAISLVERLNPLRRPAALDKRR